MASNITLGNFDTNNKLSYNMDAIIDKIPDDIINVILVANFPFYGTRQKGVEVSYGLFGDIGGRGNQIMPCLTGYIMLGKLNYPVTCLAVSSTSLT